LHSRQSIAALDDTDKENMPDKHRRKSVMERVIEKRQEEDKALLTEVREREDQRQREILAGLDWLSNSIASLVDFSKTQMEQQTQRQAEDKSRESQIFDLMKTVIQQKNNWYRFLIFLKCHIYVH